MVQKILIKIDGKRKTHAKGYITSCTSILELWIKIKCII